MRNAHLGQAARRCCCVFQVVVDNTKQAFFFQNRAYYKAWFVWWFRCLGVEEVREQAESTGSDGWLGSGGPLPQCGASSGRKVVDNTKQAFFSQTRK
jgi:hypothetical protein